MFMTFLEKNKIKQKIHGTNDCCFCANKFQQKFPNCK